MTIEQALMKLHALQTNGAHHGLENMKALMDRLGNVQDGLRYVHVAGTNGKGSTCAMVERILREAGYHTGLYTSPYVEVYNERIRLNGVPLSDEKLSSLLDRIWPEAEACFAAGIPLTEFDLGTALAFAAFAEERVDVAVVEVGLGGRLDATNIIHPLVTVITEIGMDHMQLLGSTIGEIALEKAGIMKPGVPVILAHQEKEARQVLLAAARGRGTPVQEPEVRSMVCTQKSLTMDADAGSAHYRHLQVALCGRHQANNAAAALGAIGVLREHGFRIPEDAVRRGMEHVIWPGRLEYFGNVLLDGAHNDPGVRALCEYCDEFLQAPILVTAMMRDKETERMCERFSTRVSHVIAADTGLARSLPAEELRNIFRSLGVSCEAVPDPVKALDRARKLAGERTVLVAGSLVLIGDVRGTLRAERGESRAI